MKNPRLIATISITALIVLVLIIFLAGVVIPNLVEESPNLQTSSGLTIERSNS